jgi:hypothetical protein
VYFFTGALVLISVFCLALTQYLFFKEASSIRHKYENQCPQQLRYPPANFIFRLTKIDWLKDVCHCDKYVKQTGSSDYTQQCA